MGVIGPLKRISSRTGIAILLIAAVAARASGLFAQEQSRVESNQQKSEGQRRTEELLNDKKYSFQDLLEGNPGAVANAKEIFALTSDPKIKLRGASVLLSIGKADQAQFDYLTAEAEKALNYAAEMPWPTQYDEKGEIVPNKPNPAFLKWCANRKLNAWETFESAYYEVPIPWNFLAQAREPRAHDLLMRGLRSRNIIIVALAAEGLARLQASDALDQVIIAAQRAPLETRSSIGRALLFFPDPKAQAAAEKAFTDKESLELWRKEIKAKGWKAFHDY